VLEVSSDSTPPIQVKISPNSVELNRELNDIYRTNTYNKDSFIEFLSINSNLNTEVTKFSNELNFIISLLMDLKHWGADFEFYRSQLFVTIPNLNNENFDGEARNKLKESLLRLKNNKNIYQTDLSEQEALELLQNGEVSLRNASEDLNLIEIFKSGITTWSMPYRNREGRSIRFVATINKNSVTVPIGLLEVGDEDLDCSSCLAQIALHYKGLEQLDKALTKLELALDFAKNSGDTNFTLLIQNYIADTHYDLGNYVEAEKRVEKLITSFELLNNKRSLIEMKYLKYQIMWMTGGNKKELIKSLKALAQEITEQDQESIDQRIFLENIIISCLEDIGGWENIKEAGKSKKRLADLEELVAR
jgi:tetratricopeptide (TPR) repeat protein